MSRQIQLKKSVLIAFLMASGATAGADAAIRATPQSSGTVCYTKSDGGASAFDLIDARKTGAITVDVWKTYYGQRYMQLPADRKKKTTLERYLKYAGARFKGLDKDRDGAVTCAEYKASIEKMKARRVAKAATEKAKPPTPVKPKGR